MGGAGAAGGPAASPEEDHTGDLLAESPEGFKGGEGPRDGREETPGVLGGDVSEGRAGEERWGDTGIEAGGCDADVVMDVEAEAEGTPAAARRAVEEGVAAGGPSEEAPPQPQGEISPVGRAMEMESPLQAAPLPATPASVDLAQPDSAVR